MSGLGLEGDAADEQRHRQVMELAQRLEGFLHLGGELARGLEDEGARHAGAGAALFQHVQHRQHESRRLAGAGLGEAHHVLAQECRRDGLRLDGGRDCISRGRHRREDLGAQTELGKIHVRYVKNRSGD